MGEQAKPDAPTELDWETFRKAEWPDRKEDWSNHWKSVAIQFATWWASRASGPAPATPGIEGTAEDKAEIFWNERKPALIAWVDERIANCLRIADSKTQEDRNGWIEDAGYFKQIRQVLLQQNVTLVGPAPEDDAERLRGVILKAIERAYYENPYASQDCVTANVEDALASQRPADTTKEAK